MITRQPGQETRTARRIALGARRLTALRAAIDTLVPRVDRPGEDPDMFWSRSASDLEVDAALITYLERLPHPARRDFLRLLTLLASPLPGLLSGGMPRSLAAMAPAQREALLARWGVSRLGLLRMGFASLKRLACFTTYGGSKGGTNPLWTAIGYPGPPPAPQPPPTSSLTLAPIPVAGAVIDCDLLVIGGGAGGALVACHLAEIGQQVVVLDKGPYVAPAERENLELPMVSRLFEAGGMMTTSDYAISLFAGSCMGGGTIVNWSVHWRPGEKLLQEWAQRHQLPQLLEPAFQKGVDAILRDMSVKPEVPHNRQNQALLSAARALGYSHGVLPQNVKQCERHGHAACGFCLFGCSRTGKQDAVETYLARACRAGVALYPDTVVQRLHRQGKLVTEAEAVIRRAGHAPVPVRIRARRVVLAAGALHTPALLRRSGFDHPHIGRHLKIHPVAMMLGRYPAPIDSWDGGMMTSQCDEWADQDGAGYGCRIETAPLHPGLLAAMLPWRSGVAHKTAMLDARRYAAFAVITRDRFSEGQVHLDSTGNPRVSYRIADHDRRHALRGMAAAATLHAAAGAETIHPAHNAAPVLPTADMGCDPDAYHKVLAGLDWAPNRAAFFSAHLMGSCRMGGDRTASPVRPDGRLVDCENLFVADGSLFPTASGINPVLTIQALARHVARHLEADAA